MTDVDNYLEHFGIKGMKWGVRRESSGSSSSPSTVSVKKAAFGNGLRATGGKGLPAHGDAIKAAKSQQRLKKSGVSSLSNKELKSLVERMDLEQRYSGIVEKRSQSREKKVKKFIETSKTAWNMAPDPVKKAAAQKVAGAFGAVFAATMKASGVTSALKKKKPYVHPQNY